MVGEEGHVVGIDNAAGAVEVARVGSQDRQNVTIVQGDPTSYTFEEPFDAVVGRYVLMFQRDPAGFLAGAARHACPGGIVSFHELDANGVASRPPVPTFDRVASWNTEATRRYGANPNLGAYLYAAYLTAGLRAPTILTDAIHGKGVDGANVLVQVRNLARSLLDEMERFGVATRDEVGIDTLLDRMLSEVTTTDSVVVGHLQCGAYSKI